VSSLHSRDELSLIHRHLLDCFTASSHLSVQEVHQSFCRLYSGSRLPSGAIVPPITHDEVVEKLTLLVDRKLLQKRVEAQYERGKGWHDEVRYSLTQAGLARSLKPRPRTRRGLGNAG
jgi:hypothetical protein